jgi:hypothetical protein
MVTTDQLKWALDRPEPYRLLDRAVPGGNFGEGGCLILATALQRVLGGELFAVYRGDAVMDHVVLKLDGRFLDVDGSHTEEELLDYWTAHTRGRFRMRVAPFRPELLSPDDVPFDEQVTEALTEYLRPKLGG